MVALLVGMSVAAVLVTVAMPSWQQMVRREKEAELVFRGQQYARAIGLFQKRSGPGVLPPSVDVLVTGRFLRKKFKDPITNLDFDLLSPVQAAGAPAPGQAPAGGAGRQPTTSVAPATGSNFGTQGRPQAGGRGAVGGIMGVASKSKGASLRIYNGRTHYNEWQFVYVQQVQAPSGGVPGRGGNPPTGGPQRGGQPGTPPVGPFQGGAGRQGQGQGRGGAPQGQQSGRGIQPGSPVPSPSPSPFQPRR